MLSEEEWAVLRRVPRKGKKGLKSADISAKFPKARYILRRLYDEGYVDRRPVGNTYAYFLIAKGQKFMTTTRDLILNQQKAWARRRGIRYDQKGYTLSLEDNLFRPLSLETRKELESGRGDELGGDADKPKMQALISSSALAVNVFEYWRTRNVNAIAEMCGAPAGMTEMHFEQTHPTPLGRTPPHLDIEFRGPGLKPMAIESKYTEPYQRRTKREIDDQYLNRGLWGQLSNCYRLIKRIREEGAGQTSFALLDVPQLLKHILGLATAFGSTGFELLYLWYDFPSPEAEKHGQELVDFKAELANEVNFEDMTYQELFKRIKQSPEADEDYVSYLAERYFPSV